MGVIRPHGCISLSKTRCLKIEKKIKLNTTVEIDRIWVHLAAGADEKSSSGCKNMVTEHKEPI